MLTESLLARDNCKKSSLVKLLNFPERVKKAWIKINKEQIHYSVLEEKKDNTYIFDKHKQIIIPINGI